MRLSERKRSKNFWKQIDTNKEAERLRNLMKTETSQQRKLRHAKRLRVFKALKKSGNRPGLDDPGCDPGHPSRICVLWSDWMADVLPRPT